MRRRDIYGCVLALALGVALLGGGKGSAEVDEPGSAAPVQWLCEQSAKHCVEVDTSRNLTTVYSVVNGEKLALHWQMYGTFPVVFMAGGGDHLVLGTQGNVEISEALNPDTAMLYFVERGHILKRVTFGDWYPGSAVPEVKGKASSWGRYLGLTEEGTFGVELASGERIYYQPRTGERVDTRTPLERVEDRLDQVEKRIEEVKEASP